jgi:predicted 3-demethylubiquinone-9 3-methyltransferase (glyoxalase superfamily)
MSKITPCLWFDDNAEEAVKFYTSIFKNSKIGSISRYGDAAAKAAGRPKGSVLTIMFQLNGQDYMALNGGPIFKFSEAVSLMVNCENQDELDYYWNKLSEGGDPRSQQCGWLKDKFGLSWQIVPAKMAEWAKDPARFERVMAALLPMKKLDIGALQKAYDGK